MYAINKDTFINPLQVESIKYSMSTLLTADNQRVLSFTVTMASGKEYIVDHETHGNRVDNCMQELVYHIDVSNGQSFGATEEEKEEPTSGDTMGGTREDKHEDAGDNG